MVRHEIRHYKFSYFINNLLISSGFSSTNAIPCSSFSGHPKPSNKEKLYTHIYKCPQWDQ